MTKPDAVILGAGPAGLSAACHLTSNGMSPLVLEKESFVGGISRTETHNGYGFDLGGHRFLTHIPEVEKLWFNIMGPDFLKVTRKSRILHQGHYLEYPFQLLNLLSALGPTEGLFCLISYLKSMLRPDGNPDTLEGWVTNRFGQRLFQHFFKSYSEKVWGRPCHEIRSHWSAQRIHTLSVYKALTDAMFHTGGAKSLVRSFYYPARGAGMMWDRMHQRVKEGKGDVRLSSTITGLKYCEKRITSVVYNHGREQFTLPVDHLISTISLGDLVRLFRSGVSGEVLEAARALSFRSLVLVLLVINRKDIFPDQWIYVQDERFRVGRLQNFKQWSPHLVPDPQTTSVGMEYFCDPFDTFYRMSDQKLIEFALKEMVGLGFADRQDMLDATVRRVPMAYPVYDMVYDRHLRTIQNFLSRFENLQTIGRNGMHAYNNMDLAMHLGLLAAQNVLGGSHNLWQLIENDKKYLE